jgi:hypothetical protein
MYIKLTSTDSRLSQDFIFGIDMDILKLFKSHKILPLVVLKNC